MRLLAVIFALAGVLSVHAASTALIVVGLTANETDAALWQRLAGQARTGLTARGFAPENINLLAATDGQPVTRDNVLAALTKIRTSTGADDSSWILFFGHSAPGRDGQPAFQLRGPRLTATDMGDALAGFSGPTYVLFGTEQSSDYLTALKSLPHCTAIAASNGPMSPRFPEFWVDALNANPKATFVELAAIAADRVVSYYKEQSLAQAESSSLLAEQVIKDAPFADVTVPPAPPDPKTTAPSAAASVTALEFPATAPVQGDEEFTTQPADDQTKLLLSTAQKLAETSGDYPAIILHQEMDFTFNADRTSTETKRLRVFLRRPEAVETWADFDFIHQPPSQVTVIESARVIQPDGTVVTMNPARLNGAGRPPNSELPLPFHVHLSHVVAGGIVEIAWRVEHATESELPETYVEFLLAHPVPVEDTLVTLRTPKNVPIFHQFRQLPEAPAPVESTTEHSQVLTWHLAALPAWEPLPNDPPERDLEPMLVVSSLSSWDAFTAWFRRITQGAFEAGPATNALADKIAQAHPSPADRLRTAYEEVSALRYVAIELGIHGFQPRSPDTVLANHYGDCKDKATLLVALLRKLDIPAEFALVNRGSSTDTSFPGWQFNHALVHVPPSEGIPEQWLDATDGTTPPGFVGPGDLGRNALVFSSDHADFLTITDSKQATSVSDSWTVAQQPDGSWKGQLERKLTGLADEALREELRPLTPIQRIHWLQTYFSNLSNDMEFSDLTLSDLSNLEVPLAVTIEVQTPPPAQPFGPEHPLASAPAFPPGLPLLEAVAAPQRDRPFLVNDGQLLHYEQHITLTFNHPVDLPAVQTKSDDAHAKSAIAYSRPDPHTVVRNTALDIFSPLVPTSDYAKFRRDLLDWRHALTIFISPSNT